jgi:hypothetical protein
MINNDSPNKMQEELEPTPPENHEPDDSGGIFVQGFLKIFDPETGKIITQGRA